MENLTDLYRWLHDNGAILIDRELHFSNPNTKATTIRLSETDTYGIFIDTTRIETVSEEKMIMLHESGHFATGATHEVCSSFDLVSKHEYKADKWAVQRLVTADELDDAVAEGHTELWDLADYFSVTEDFMRKAVCWYTHGNLATELYF
ncbi:MAG: ImmA/IrrE family metallo-endopeptidase [Bacillota bacterium]